jgi:hypothetical protein
VRRACERRIDRGVGKRHAVAVIELLVFDDEPRLGLCVPAEHHIKPLSASARLALFVPGFDLPDRGRNHQRIGVDAAKARALPEAETRMRAREIYLPDFLDPGAQG